MRSIVHTAVTLLLGIAVALAWAGMIMWNSGEPDFVEHFWLFGFYAFFAAFVILLARHVWLETVGE